MFHKIALPQAKESRQEATEKTHFLEQVLPSTTTEVSSFFVSTAVNLTHITSEQVLSSRDLAHRSLIETQKAEIEAKVAEREAEIQRLYTELAKLVRPRQPLALTHSHLCRHRDCCHHFYRRCNPYSISPLRPATHTLLLSHLPKRHTALPPPPPPSSPTSLPAE